MADLHDDSAARFQQSGKVPHGVAARELYTLHHMIPHSSDPANGNENAPEAGAPEWNDLAKCGCPVCARLNALVENARKVGGEIFGLDVRKDVWRGPVERLPRRWPDSWRALDPVADKGKEARPSAALNGKQQMPHADKGEYKVVFSRMAVIDGRYF
jgi:hypothetical protein